MRSTFLYMWCIIPGWSTGLSSDSSGDTHFRPDLRSRDSGFVATVNSSGTMALEKPVSRRNECTTLAMTDARSGLASPSGCFRQAGGNWGHRSQGPASFFPPRSWRERRGTGRPTWSPTYPARRSLPTRTWSTRGAWPSARPARSGLPTTIPAHRRSTGETVRRSRWS